MLRCAAIDIGSNAMRLLVAEVMPSGKLRPLVRRRESIRLGRDVFKGGKISQQLLTRSVRVLKDFKAVCKRYKVTRIRAVGTSALREAKNKASFVASVRTRTGVAIEIISGTEEARLIQLAVSQAVDLSRGLAVTIDMGGGSTEVCLVRDGDVVMSETHPIGAVRLLHLLEADRYSAAHFSRLVRDYVHGLQHQLQRHIGKQRVSVCVGTGGNFEALGELRKTLLGQRQSDRLPLRDLRRILSKLRSLSVDERIDTLGLRPDRADVIAPAAEVLAEIMRSAKVREVRLPGVGLKEGVVLDMVARVKPLDRHAERQHRIAFAVELAHMYQSDMRHAEAVRKHAVYLFDRLRAIHRLDAHSRLLLEIAAVLHDIGHFVNTDDHHKHSMYLIRATPFVGLDQRSQNIIACIARYHRRACPKGDHEVYRDLSPADQRTVRMLSALLRIADAADRGVGRVNTVSLRLGRGQCTFVLKGRGEMLLEQWAVARKADLFTKEYRKKVIVSARK